MKFKILDTKWKRDRRTEIILMILFADNNKPLTKLQIDAIYHLVIKALDYDWIHPNY